MSLKTITPPATEPLTANEVKQYLRIDGTDDDALISSFITQAREFCEDYQGKKYITQTLELILDEFPFDYSIDFRACSPIQSVTSVKYYDTSNTEYTLSSNDYIVDADSFVARIALAYNKSWPTIQLKPVNGVVIRFVAGYGNAASVPETFKQAMVAHIKILADGTLFNLREGEKEKFEAVRNSLLGTRRVINV